MVSGFVTGFFENHCTSGKGVTFMELWGDVTRYNAADGRWYTLNNCHKSGLPLNLYQSCSASFDCYHPTTRRKYRNSASGYSVVKGVGYFGTHNSATVEQICI